jgi:PAS domain S-box-containing protein
MYLAQWQTRFILLLIQLCSAKHSLASIDESSALLLGILLIAAFAGMLIGVLVVARLVFKTTWRTAQQRAALQASEERYRLVTERSVDMIALTDDRGRIRYASPSFRSTLGHDPALVLGRMVFDQVHPDDMAETTTHFADVCRYGTGQASFRLRHADGTWRWLEAQAARMIDNGHPVVVIVARDITERKQLEVQLLQWQKLDTIGHLAGGVVHDLNNLLMAIASFAEIGRHELSPEHPVQDDLNEIIKGTVRAATLTRTLLAFARQQMPAACVLDLNDLILDLDRLLHQLIGPGIILNLQPAPDLWQIKGNASQLEQVIVNLVVNARDAMPSGGVLTIATANITLNTTSVHSHTDGATDEHILLTISDIGSGMDEATQAHLFAPFFTTKAPGQGTGLGLSTCKNIITQHGGAIDVSSALGTGTSVTISLRRAVEDTPEAACVTPPSSPVCVTAT